jgi:hypothetical protein
MSALAQHVGQVLDLLAAAELDSFCPCLKAVIETTKALARTAIETDQVTSLTCIEIPPDYLLSKCSWW